jgi:hypothetical protein
MVADAHFNRDILSVEEAADGSDVKRVAAVHFVRARCESGIIGATKPEAESSHLIAVKHIINPTFKQIGGRFLLSWRRGMAANDAALEVPFPRNRIRWDSVRLNIRPRLL